MLSWLMEEPTSEYLDKARYKYSGWIPQLHDCEWESERIVLALIASEVLRAEKALLGGRKKTSDTLESAMRCVRLAGSRMSRYSGEC